MPINNIAISDPFVSVLIPVFNRETYISECLISAITQTFQNFEIIIVDNASTDGTWAICEDFSARDSRVRIFRNDYNVGPVRNWQRCINEARGTYAKILFSDDLMSPEFLEKALPFLEDESVGFVFSSIDVGERPGSGGEPYWWRRSSGIWPRSAFIKEALLGGKVPVSPGAALFRLADLRKNLILDIPSAASTDFTRYGAGPDLLLYLLTAGAYPKVAYLAEPLIFFRSHPESITMRENNDMITSHYFQAKVWFAGQMSSAKAPLFGSLLQMCLVYGWLMQRRQHVNESLPAFCRRYVDPAPAIGWLIVARVRLYRLRIRYQRSIWRFMSKINQGQG